MKLNEIEIAWQQDSTINQTDLGGEALKIPKLHAKYHAILNNEKLVLMKYKHDLDKLQLLLEEYFSKTLTTKELADYGLPPYTEKRILKTDIQKYIDTWPDIVAQKLKIGTQHEKIEYLKDILKMIHGRSFQLRDAIEWFKFTNGG